ncbi:MAG: single-stranded DNA-binding protein [Ruminococcus flavefaciens]|nr:single-stranded DNA-binding protein [Ruminococcus flavefaciens]
MNKVILMGRLTADPVLRQTQSGSVSCGFRIAVSRRFANKQTGEREADFIQCTAWGQTAEFVNRYFKKGSMICVEGQLRSGSYQDRNHPDVTHYTTDVYVDNVEFTGSKAETGTAGGNNYNNGYNNYGGNNYSVPQGNYNAPPQNNYQPQNDYSNNYSAPAQTNAPDNNSMSYGNINDYEEILSDGDVPF